MAPALRLSWLPKITNGFFFRADTFADVAKYINEVGDPTAHGGGRLLERSRGESFLAVFENRFKPKKRSIYLMDEPENALSPIRQLAFMRLLWEWELSGNAQMIIATHSPILMSYPGATILSFDGNALTPTAYEDTEHYRVTKSFLGNPQAALDELLAPDEEGDET
ncbi:MAG: AAA family ATPase [Pseudomonadota bacterium]